jgi:hypothetical protein
MHYTQHTNAIYVPQSKKKRTLDVKGISVCSRRESLHTSTITTKYDSNLFTGCILICLVENLHLPRFMLGVMENYISSRDISIQIILRSERSEIYCTRQFLFKKKNKTIYQFHNQHYYVLAGLWLNVCKKKVNETCN